MTPTVTVTPTGTETETPTPTATEAATPTATPFYTYQDVPQGCQQIPNYTGIGAGYLFRQDINAHFCGGAPVSTATAKIPFATLQNIIEVDGWRFYCTDCSATIPCSSGGGGTFASGSQGQWNCANGLVTVTGAITGVTAGNGLTGGGTGGTVTLGISAPVSIANGGTNAATAAAARMSLGAAASGTNTDITSLGGLTTPLSLGQGGTSCGAASTFSALPGSPSAGTICAITDAIACTDGTAVTVGGGGAKCTLGWNGSNWMPMDGSAPSGGSGTITAVTAGNGLNGGGTSGSVAIALTAPVSIANGGTNASTAAAARTSLGAAASGTNTDITSLGGLTTPLLVSEGGTSCVSPSTYAGLTALPANGAICVITDAVTCTQGTAVTSGGGTLECAVVRSGGHRMPINGSAPTQLGAQINATVASGFTVPSSTNTDLSFATVVRDDEQLLQSRHLSGAAGGSGDWLVPDRRRHRVGNCQQWNLPADPVTD